MPSFRFRWPTVLTCLFLLGFSALAKPDLPASASIIVNARNQASLSSVDLGLILVGRQQYWETGDQIIVAYLQGSSVCEDAIREHTGMDERRYRHHWRRAAFTGNGVLPRAFREAQEVIDFVARQTGAIGIIGRLDDPSPAVRVLDLSSMAFSGINKEDPVLIISKPDPQPLR